MVSPSRFPLPSATLSSTQFAMALESRRATFAPVALSGTDPQKPSRHTRVPFSCSPLAWKTAPWPRSPNRNVRLMRRFR